MVGPTQQEREAFLWMQGRLIELLLRHSVERFRNTFAEVELPPEEGDPRLDRYRLLAVIFYLQGELLDSILPRIKRRLSFAAPRHVAVEEPPTRGHIDWARTAAASWRERPGEVPLEVYTRQRRRDFATPENLLTIATLLQFRAAAAQLLDLELDEDGAGAIRHPLNDIVEFCSRELSFPQFVGLVPEATLTIEGYADESIDDLERQVEENLLPGRNSAYDDLLSWRRRFTELRLLDRIDLPTSRPMLGADPARDNYLYQVWLFYEMGDMLQRSGRLLDWDQHAMVLRYSWGDGVEYRLQHDQAIPGMPKHWPDAPGVRPDFYIERVGRNEVRHEQELIWREPGYVLDAKYYKPRDSAKAPTSPVKRMMADLQLSSERHGALLFAFQSSSSAGSASNELHSEEPDIEDSVQAANLLYQVAPREMIAQAIVPDTAIGIWSARPAIAGDGGVLAQTLTTLFGRVHEVLKEEVPVRCHGFFLDTLTANAHGVISNSQALLWRDGSNVAESADDLLVCPKPHVAGWRIDLVSRSRDCCQNPALCHVIHLPDVRPPQRLSALEDIQAAIRSVDNEHGTEEITALATEHVLNITRRYVDLFRPDLKRYQLRAREKLDLDDLFDTTPLLTDTQRQTLALGLFLMDQIELTGADNYAGPILLFTGVLEWASKQSVLYEQWRRQPLSRANGQTLLQTLGTLGSLAHKDQYNYQLVEATIVRGGHWQQPLPSGQLYPFKRWLIGIDAIVDIRNQAAHEAVGNAVALRKLTNIFFGSPNTGVGLLAGLLLSWVR